MTTKFDIKKILGENDNGLWRLKIKVILIQQGCANTLKGESMLVFMSQKENVDMINRIRNVIILCLSDKSLREVTKDETATSMWVKLESLYITSSLTHKLYLKQQLYSFRMIESRTMVEYLTNFNKILDDLENTKVKLYDKNKALIILNILVWTFEYVECVKGISCGGWSLERRMIKPIHMFEYIDPIVIYALAVVGEIVDSKPKSFLKTTKGLEGQQLPWRKRLSI